ncbi:MAG: VCBS repeat-containing protein [Planctomycetota bacterium]|nr:MAG: VCBS repeat-containing protein [Planctomycetota bacterium]
MRAIEVWLAALVAVGTTGCQSWERTRKEVVHPLNALLHRDYPRSLRGPANAERALGLHAPALQPQARAELTRLLAPFAEVRQSRCLIVEAAPGPGKGAWTARCRLSLDGVDAEGKRWTVRQAQALTCAPGPDGWRIEGRRVEDPEVVGPGGPTFREEAGLRGVVFAHRSRGVPDHRGRVRPYLPGSGLTAVDVDDDGLDDLLLVGGGELRLLRNLGGRFRDETEERGLVAPERGECRLGIFGDIDGDGDLDLFLGVVDAENALYLGTPEGRFERVSARERGLVGSGQTTSACFADFDGDGDLDLYVVNGMNLTQREPDPIYDARNGTPNQLFRNRGDGTFEEVGAAAGVDDEGWGLACTTADMDRDGDVDLFLANDFGLDKLYANRGDGTFEEVSEEWGIVHSNPSMSADFGDLDGDGLLDLFVAGMASNSRWIVRMPGFPARGPFPLNVLIRGLILESMWGMLHGNRVYRGLPGGGFEEVSEAWGLRDQEWGWATPLFDYDNDGDLDAYGVNGFWSGDEPDDL